MFLFNYQEIYEELFTFLLAITLYRGTSGHTSMPSNTENGKLQSGACNYLKDREQGFIHVTKNEKCDPDYTVSWASVAAEVNGKNVELPTMFDFLLGLNFCFPLKAGKKACFTRYPIHNVAFAAPLILITGKFQTVTL